MDTLALRVVHRDPEKVLAPPPDGMATIGNGVTHAFLLTPAEIDPERRYPLVTVLHGAGRQGFVAIDTNAIGPDDPKPRILLEHGTHDTVFPFEAVCTPNVELLRRLGYEVDLRVDRGGIHWPSPGFQTAALDWFLV